jgi:hypothetical protein
LPPLNVIRAKNFFPQKNLRFPSSLERDCYIFLSNQGFVNSNREMSPILPVKTNTIFSQTGDFRETRRDPFLFAQRAVSADSFPCSTRACVSYFPTHLLANEKAAAKNQE